MVLQVTKQLYFFLSVPTIEEPVQAGTHPNASKTALDKFMKFDRKYASIKEPKRSDLIVEETDESEPIINYEKSTPSPRDSHHGQSRLRRQAEQVINVNTVFPRTVSAETILF